MSRKRLKFNPVYKKDMKHLLFDILFTEKTFMVIQKEHRNVNAKEFFTNLDKFNLKITEGRNREDIINNRRLDKIFEDFFQKLELINLEIDEKKRPKK